MLSENLKTLLGTTFAMYTKIHGFHFNVEGSDFPQYHEFFNDFYTDVYSTIDRIGEYIRTLDSYTPGSISRMLELSILEEQTKIPRAELMMAELLDNSEKIIELVKNIFEEAANDGEQSIANYMADLQGIYSKHRWMLRSILKTDRS